MTSLSEKNILASPIDQFRLWFDEAKKTALQLPEAFCLSTVSDVNLPAGRMLLLKAVENTGFVFYTNFNSPKGRALKKNPNAAMTFYWEPLRRQVRISGIVEQVSAADADRYFASRPRPSQIGAWASSQSEVVASREVLDNIFSEYEKKFVDKEIPRPDYWSGFRLLPTEIEFWQEQAGRMHDRLLYRKLENKWNTQRLFP